MMIGKMNGVMIFCKKVPLVAEFYRDILGFKHQPTPEFKESKFYILKSGSFLLKLHSASKPNDGRQKLQMLVKDLEQAREKLIALGVRCGAIHYGYFDVKDPEGNVVQFHEAD